MKCSTTKLVNSGIAYKWRFPFKLLTDYKGRTVVVKSLQQAKEFEVELEKEEVEVEVLNSTLEEIRSRAQRRQSAIYRVRKDHLS